MPSPWVQSSLDPGWIEPGVSPGSVVEFVAYSDRAKAQARVLATVVDTLKKGFLGTCLVIRMRCVEKQDLLYIGSAGDLAQNVKETLGFTSAALRTDTLRVIELKDLEDRVGDWW